MNSNSKQIKLECIKLFREIDFLNMSPCESFIDTGSYIDTITNEEIYAFSIFYKKDGEIKKIYNIEFHETESDDNCLIKVLEIKRIIKKLLSEISAEKWKEYRDKKNGGNKDAK